MRKLKWLYPGMRIKRWIALIIFGISMLSVGFVITLNYRGASTDTEAGAGVVIIIGLVAIIAGIRKLIKNILNIFLPEKREKELVDLIYRKRYLEKGPRIVVLSGGSGLYQLLAGLKEYSSNITALITLLDDEGIIGKLKENSLNLENSDIKNAIAALADAGSIVNTLFNFRFRDMTELWGYEFGNIFLTAVSHITGNLEDAIKESSLVLGARGKVILSTLDKIMLIAQYSGGEKIYSKREILKQTGAIENMWVNPRQCQINAEARDAIQQADIVVIGPGSLYTGVIPGLLIDNMPEIIARSKALKIFVTNTMTQPGQTEDFKASDHVKKLLHYSAGQKIIDYCLINTMSVPKDIQQRYSLEGSLPVEADLENINQLGVKTIGRDLLDKSSSVAKHGIKALAKAIVDLVINVRTRR